MGLSCKRRGHKWRVIGFNPAFSLGHKDHVHIECQRCGRSIVAEILRDEGGIRT